MAEELRSSFLGYQSSFEEARVVIVQVPYGATTTYGHGTKSGPAAIIDASNHLEIYDIELKKNICEEIGIHTLDAIDIDKKSAEEVVSMVEHEIKKLIKAGKKPVVFGGEHSITAGVVAGFNNPSLSVLQIDAHADLRDVYDGTKYSHACPMRRVREITRNTVQVGIRSMCKEEADYIQEENLEKDIFYADDFRNESIANIVSRLRDEVYITVDVDGFDPSVIPGTGTPEPGGLEWNSVLSLMDAVSKKKKVVGFDVVEVSPIPGLPTSEFAAAKLAYKMMGYFWART